MIFKLNSKLLKCGERSPNRSEPYAVDSTSSRAVVGWLDRLKNLLRRPLSHQNSKPISWFEKRMLTIQTLDLKPAKNALSGRHLPESGPSPLGEDYLAQSGQTKASRNLFVGNSKEPVCLKNRPSHSISDLLMLFTSEIPICNSRKRDRI